MSQSLEIEYKNMLTESEYYALCEHFKVSDKIQVTQKNTYLDSNSILRNQGCSLRIREFSDHAELTLKVPQETGLLEYNQPLSTAMATHAIKTRQLIVLPEIAAILAQLDLNFADLEVLGSLKTKRVEFMIPLGKLALDESWYQNQHDFELELEVQETNTSKTQFKQFLAELGVIYRPAESKVKRALKKY